MKQAGIVLCGREGPALNAVFHALRRDVNITLVLAERKPQFPGRLAARVRRRGGGKVFGQVLFSRLLLPCIQWRSKPAIRTARGRGGLDCRPAEDRSAFTPVPSVNHPSALGLLAERPASAVALFSSSILQEASLKEIPAPVINLHLGLSRHYRGLFCTYWALVEGRPETCGVTVHLVDNGVDTGPVLGEKAVVPHPEDTVAGYDWRNLAEGLPLFRDILAGICERGLPGKAGPGGRGILKTVPTLGEYISNRNRTGVA